MDEFFWSHERDDPLERLRAEVIARNKDRERPPQDRSIEEVMEARRAYEIPSDNLERFQRVARQLMKLV
jgi:hypothetical protein